ncbi:hypothetical protein H312_01380 [Anncaliia algerae PRA339]|uniref:40S ribosomal protein S1 n=1 Tax=Anncaliia algerae PRA339 TaxID=1288291 RepID=A0A059F1W5_9MICR|nr:hypothetical protein H312_01380 [Anncaliia algerae PRA339]
MKKGLKKKPVDNFSKKEWYTLKVPDLFVKNEVGKTLVTKHTTKSLHEKAMIGRNFEVSQGDLNPNDEINSSKKFRFVITNINGVIANSEFNGMELTKDMKKGIIRKWHTLVKAHQDVKTKDGYELRIFVMGVTRKRAKDTKKTCYAKTSDVKRVRRIIFDLIDSQFSELELSKVIKLLQTDNFGKEVEKKTYSIVPLQNVVISKVKVISRPKKSEENN